MNHTRPVLYVMLGVLGLLSGCVASKHPLAEPKPSADDRQLYGVWVKSGPGTVEQSWLKFAPTGPNTPPTHLANQSLMVMREYTTSSSGPREYNDDEYRVFLTKLGDRVFLTRYFEPSKDAAGEPMPGGFEFFLCQVEKDQLILTEMNSEATAKAVRQGLLEGEIEEREHEIQSPKKVAIETPDGKRISEQEDAPEVLKRTSVYLTSSTEQLRSFFAAEKCLALFKDGRREVYRRHRSD